MANFSRTQRGFTYLSLLFFVAVLGIGLAVTAVSWQTERQRDKERELLAIGNEFRDAIALYYYRSPDAIKQYPRDLSDLVKDARYPFVQRYLRRVYRDPMTGNAEWGIVREIGGGIMGVHSLSLETPAKRKGFREEQQFFETANAYADWKFVFAPLPLTTIRNGVKE